MENKRGAIQLSVTTIIVVVIGITLLVLGLTWVRGIFTKLGEISDKTFDKAQGLIGGLENVDSLLTVIPDKTAVQQKGDDAVKVVVANFEQSTIGVTLRAQTTDEDLSCGFLDGKEIVNSRPQYTLKSGEQKSEPLILKDQGGPIRTTSCRVFVEGDDTAELTVVVRVEKGQSGIFG